MEADPPPVEVFVRSWLPPSPSRLLEIGAGPGDLADDLRGAGHDVVAIDEDPRVADVDGVEYVALEDLTIDEPFDAVIARRSLHHVGAANTAIGALLRALAPSGLLIVEGFAWDVVDFSTASWMYAESLRLGDVDASEDPVGFFEDWRMAHREMLGWDQLRSILDAVAEQEHFVWIPYLAEEYLHGDDHARMREREQLAEGRLHGGGFRYVGRRPG